jgi:Domain of unknown function (DUF4864)
MRILLIVLTALLGLAASAYADDVSEAQAVIHSQEQAMIRDDDAAAYSFAGPPITSMYRDASTFMHMVRNGYAPVNRHKSFEFGEAKTSDDKVIQYVHIIDADGVAWEAQYTLQRQTDGTMKIISCSLLKAASV